jgi:glycosyltransferase involved in cell wall biosynthesis
MNPPLVSVVVPTYNSAAHLGPCLRSIREQTYPAIELVVVDNASVDPTKEIAGELADQVFDKGPERSAQRNYGVRKSQGEYVLIVDSDMVLSQDVVRACVEKVQEFPALKAVVIPETSFGEGFWARCKELERSFYVGVDWMEAARFFPREVFDAMGGYDEANTGTEDYDLPLRIRAEHGDDAVDSIDRYIHHDEQRISLRTTCRKKFYYGGNVDRYRSAHAGTFRKQANPLYRYALFLRRPRSLLGRPHLAAGMVFMKTAELAAGAAGHLAAKYSRTRRAR